MKRRTFLSLPLRPAQATAVRAVVLTVDRQEAHLMAYPGGKVVLPASLLPRGVKRGSWVRVGVEVSREPLAEEGMRSFFEGLRR